MRTVFATLGAVFPEVETWELDNGDLALVATLHPVDHDLAKLAARMREEPFKSALAKTWRATDLSGLLAHFVATAELTRRIAEVDRDRINTDDQNLIELGFARTTGTGLSRFSVEDVRRAGIAGLRGGAETAGGSALALATVCWADVDEARYAFYVAEEAAPTEPPSTGPERAHRIAALHAFGAGQSHLVVSEWGAQPAQPRGPTELAIVAWALADTGQSAATTYAERLSTFDAGEALAVVAHLAVRTDKLEEATVALEGLFKLLRDDPWPMHRLVKLAIDDAMMVAAHDGQTALRLYSALREPFAVRVLDDYREQAAFSISLLSPGPSCVEAAARLEPYTPWNEAFLRARAECFVAQKAPGREASIREWQEFQASRPSDFAEGLTR